MPEEVIVCQKNGQWGFLLECGDFVTAWRPVGRNKKYGDRPFSSLVQVLGVIELIKAQFHKEYGDVLPWRVRVE